MCLMVAGLQAGALGAERALPPQLPATLSAWAWQLGGTPQVSTHPPRTHLPPLVLVLVPSPSPSPWRRWRAG